MDQLYAGAALIVVGFGILYCFGLVAAGLLEFRRKHRRISDQGHGDYNIAEDTAPRDTMHASHHVYALVAALNESAVIEATVRGLLAQSPDLRVILVDDASTDATAEIAQHVGGDRITIVSRVLPVARLGKGPALNVGFAHVVEDVRQRQLDPDRVLVCVMDADGRLSTGAVDSVALLFEDERVGGVQLAVRILNRGSLLTEMQDFEFWGVSALAQVGRMGTGTVSLGGNGQFARLSALLGLGRPPWSSSLTEDLDLTISLLLDGWRLTSSMDASVGQQAVGSLRQLVRQRTRWFQGHMVCGRRLLDVWGSQRMSHAAVFELSLYLSIPWLLVLPWSVFFHVGLLFALGGAGIFDSGSSGGVGRILAWLVVSFAPSLTFGVLYARRNRAVGVLRALLLSQMLIVITYVGYIAAWAGLRRILRHQNEWDKTRRLADLEHPVPATVERPQRQPVESAEAPFQLADARAYEQPPGERRHQPAEIPVRPRHGP